LSDFTSGFDILMNMSETDLQLLTRYASQHAEDAFAEIVRRHVDLVHSAALRQVRSRELAEEVAQIVFIELARQARNLPPRTVLAAWLYHVTGRRAIDVVRREAGRRIREQTALELQTMNATAEDWSHIEPLLDDAMDALEETDRLAVLLRYFQNKPLREVGEAMGVTDDAAQKRVSRAVERLRVFFDKRGVALGASGLAVIISANAIQAAPVGLAVTISNAVALATTSLVSISTATATKTIVMTTLQKTIIATTLIVAVGTAIYEKRQASVMRVEISAARKKLPEQIQQLTSERDAAILSASANQDELQRLRQTQNELMRLRGEVGILRRQTNELGKLSEENQRLQPAPPPEAPTAEQISELVVHKQDCAEAWMQAFLAYAKKNQGQLPASFEQAEPYWPRKTGKWPDVSADQFEILYHGSLDALPNQDVIVFREKKLWQHVNGKWGRFDVLANGNVQYGSVPNGSRDDYVSDYEREHLAVAR
jgi:RNA polymerase sigma factor (sigma-70 family)